MNALDFSPLFRTAIGFDRLARQLETARTAPDAQSYPPYNIEKTGEDSYVLTMAVAGFGPGDIEVVARDNTLAVSGRAPQPEEGRSFLHRGIAGRAFERRFVLADHIVVEGATLDPGERPAAAQPQARGAGGAEAPPHRGAGRASGRRAAGHRQRARRAGQGRLSGRSSLASMA
jgi:molecular chaperone IbpA